MRTAADGRGLLLTVRRSKTDQERTAADVRYLKNGAAAAVWAIRPPAPADDASVVGVLNGQSIARRVAADVRSAGIEGRITGHSGRVGLASELTARGASTTETMLAGGWRTARTAAEQTYTEGVGIIPLALPEATGGNGTLSYSLRPTVPGLTFAAATRTLSGTPTTAGTYDMTYQVADGDANTAVSDAAALSFTITVHEPEPPDTVPTFADPVDDQTYTDGEAISPLTLPEASGGNGPLSYSLTPTVPGLTFAAAKRTLSGAPTSAGSFDMTYQVIDGDDNTTASDAATLTFTITVQPAATLYVGCSADAETWRGLRVCSERPRDGYHRPAFGTGYRTLEDEIIAALPPTMKADGQVYTPYSCTAFDITPSGTAATDIEHIVALAEAHDSGIDDDRRRDIASDLDNLTIADPTVNRSQKGARDAAEWMPTRHGEWFAERVIQVKLEYGLTVDTAERNALEALLAGGGAQLHCVN